MHRWESTGLMVGSINIRGASLFKLFLILEQHTLDVLCIQETWLAQSTVQLQVPGFVVYEERRTASTNKRARGGMAMLVRKGIKVAR
jgi:exonuclease III